MNTLDIDGLRCFQFASLAGAGVTHAVFGRQGGVSPAPYGSLNVSISTGDARENVRENRRRAFRALGREPESIADLWQVHSADVVPAPAPFGENSESPKADALVTDNPAVTLFLRFADCTPILLVDPRRRAVGLVHAGWKGTLLKAAAAAVRALGERYGSRPHDLLAAVGPSIGPCHYEVGPEVVEQTRAAFPDRPDLLRTPAELRPGSAGARPHLDLWAANQAALVEAGLAPEQVEIAGLCTACHTDSFFSHRAEGPRTGRFGALLALA